MTFRRTSRGAPIAWLAALLLAACGSEDPPKHGLEREQLASRPTGDAIDVVYGAPDGAEYKARITLDQEFSQRRTGEGPAQGADKTASAVIEMHQAFTRPHPERLRSEIVFRYVEAKGEGAAKYLARAPIRGTVEHEADGRPKPHSLTVTGGTKAEQVEVLDLVGALGLAGFGGSPPWIPSRSVRVGEAWQLESFVKPRAVAKVALQVQRSGLEAPAPTFSGTARLERVQRGKDGLELEVSLDALLEIDGKVRKDGGEAHMSVGDRMRGRAVISAATGLPVSFRVTHSRRVRVRSPVESIDQEFTSRLEGRVERLGRR